MLTHPCRKDTLLQELYAWWDSDGPPIAWLTGRPGTGKTMLAAWLSSYGPTPEEDSALRQLGALRSAVVATYFCQAGETLQNLVNGVLGQVATNVLTLRLQLTRERGGAPDSRNVFAPLLSLDTSGERQRMLIVIDGLDELDDSAHAAAILATAKVPAGLRLLVTTLDAPDVMRHVGQSEVRRLPDQVAEDEGVLTAYVEGRLRAGLALDDAARPRVCAEIVRRASGLFLYAALTLDMLSDQADQARGLTVDDLPKLAPGLTEFYRSSLARIQDWTVEHETVLGLIGVARGDGLTPGRLRAIAGPTVTGALRALEVYLVGRRDEPRRLFHRSFADFLFDRDTNEWYFLDAKEMHRRIGLHYVGEFSDRWNECDRYGRMYTLDHLILAGEDHAVDKLISRSWIEARLPGHALKPEGVDLELGSDLARILSRQLQCAESAGADGMVALQTALARSIVERHNQLGFGGTVLEALVWLDRSALGTLAERLARLRASTTDVVTGLLRVGFARAHSGLPDRALALELAGLAKALHAGPARDATVADVCQLLIDVGLPSEAEKLMSSELVISSEHRATLYEALANYMVRHDRAEEAAALAGKERYNTNEAFAVLRLVEAAVAAGKPPVARAVLARGLRSSRRNLPLVRSACLATLSVARLRLSKVETAEEHGTDSHTARSMRHALSILRRARMAFDRAVAGGKEDKADEYAPILCLATAYAEVGDITQLAEIAALNERPAVVLCFAAPALARAGAMEDAMRIVTRAAAEPNNGGSDYAFCLNQVAHALARNGDSRARAVFDQALALARDDRQRSWVLQTMIEVGFHDVPFGEVSEAGELKSIVSALAKAGAIDVALQRCPDIGSPELEADALAEATVAAVQAGRSDARAILEASIRTSQRHACRALADSCAGLFDGLREHRDRLCAADATAWGEDGLLGRLLSGVDVATRERIAFRSWYPLWPMSTPVAAIALETVRTLCAQGRAALAAKNATSAVEERASHLRGLPLFESEQATRFVLSEAAIALALRAEVTAARRLAKELGDSAAEIAWVARALANGGHVQPALELANAAERNFGCRAVLGAALLSLPGHKAESEALFERAMEGAQVPVTMHTHGWAAEPHYDAKDIGQLVASLMVARHGKAEQLLTRIRASWRPYVMLQHIAQSLARLGAIEPSLDMVADISDAQAKTEALQFVATSEAFLTQAAVNPDLARRFLALAESLPEPACLAVRWLAAVALGRSRNLVSALRVAPERVSPELFGSFVHGANASEREEAWQQTELPVIATLWAGHLMLDAPELSQHILHEVREVLGWFMPPSTPLPAFQMPPAR